MSHGDKQAFGVTWPLGTLLMKALPPTSNIIEIFKDIMAEFGGQETFHLTSTLPDSMLNAKPFQWFLPLASCDPRVSVPLTPQCLLPPGTVHTASLLGVPTQGLTLL